MFLFYKYIYGFAKRLYFVLCSFGTEKKNTNNEPGGQQEQLSRFRGPLQPMSHLPRTHPSRFLSWQMFPYVSSLPLSLCLVAEKITKRKKKTFWSFGTFCIPFHVSFQIVKILQRLEFWVSWQSNGASIFFVISVIS